jgi:hypothetical protein
MAAERKIAASLHDDHGHYFVVQPERVACDDERYLTFRWESIDEGNAWSLRFGDPATKDAIRSAFGFDTGVVIELSAVCRGRASDRVPARLAAKFLEQREGVLAFDGLLSPSLDPPEWAEWYARLADHYRSWQHSGPTGPRAVAGRDARRAGCGLCRRGNVRLA